VHILGTGQLDPSALGCDDNPATALPDCPAGTCDSDPDTTYPECIVFTGSGSTQIFNTYENLEANNAYWQKIPDSTYYSGTSTGGGANLESKFRVKNGQIEQSGNMTFGEAGGNEFGLMGIYSNDGFKDDTWDSNKIHLQEYGAGNLPYQDYDLGDKMNMPSLSQDFRYADCAVGTTTYPNRVIECRVWRQLEVFG